MKPHQAPLRNDTKQASQPDHRGSRLLLRGIESLGLGPLTAEVAAGQRVSVIGHSDNEAEALFEVLCGQRSLTRGEILLDGRTFSASSGPAAQIVSVHRPASEQALDSIRESLQVGARAARALHILDICDLSEHDLQSLPTEPRLIIRLSLASALLRNPPMLVLHDVERSFETGHWLQIEEHLRVYRGSILRFTRDITALRNADMIWYLAEGRLLWVSAPSPLLDATSDEWPAPSWLAEARGN